MKPLQPIMDMLERADNPRAKAVMVCKESQGGANAKQANNQGTALELTLRQQAVQQAYNQQQRAAQNGIGNLAGYLFGNTLGGGSR